MYYIGIDLGTSAVKLLLMDETGRIDNIVSREYGIAFPHPGWSEQEPADWWDAVCDGIPALLQGFDISDAVIPAENARADLFFDDTKDIGILFCKPHDCLHNGRMQVLFFDGRRAAPLWASLHTVDAAPDHFALTVAIPVNSFIARATVSADQNLAQQILAAVLADAGR